MIKQKRLSTSTPKYSYPQVDNKQPIQYDRNMITYRTPAEWESHEGIHIADRSVFQDETTPISFNEFKEITGTLTVEIVNMKIEADKGRQKLLLKERIETKIEEYKEFGLSTIDFDAGLIRGLELALDILEES